MQCIGAHGSTFRCSSRTSCTGLSPIDSIRAAADHDNDPAQQGDAPQISTDGGDTY
jgi:hypothetical protein